MNVRDTLILMFSAVDPIHSDFAHKTLQIQLFSIHKAKFKFIKMFFLPIILPMFGKRVHFEYHFTKATVLLVEGKRMKYNKYSEIPAYVA